jgi:hypothetical protein
MINQTLEIKTDIVLLDIIGYSLLSDDEQLSTVEVLQSDLTNQIHFTSELSNLRNTEVVLGYAPTGDGMYILVNPQICGYGVVLGLSIRNFLLWLSRHQSNALYQGVRVSVHMGRALSFTDVNGVTNYVGDGMNDCARLLSVADEDAIEFNGDKNYVIASETACYWFNKLFASRQAKQFLSTMAFKMSALHIITDKHSKVHKGYLVDSVRHTFIPPPNFLRGRKHTIGK